MTGKGIDYDSGPYHVMVPPNEISVVLSIPISNDDLLEGNEKFSLTIHATSMPDRVDIGNPDQATVTIVDDDGKYSTDCYYNDVNELNLVARLRCKSGNKTYSPLLWRINEHIIQ